MKIVLLLSIMMFGLSPANIFSANDKNAKNKANPKKDLITEKLKLTSRQQGKINSLNNYFVAQKDLLNNDLTLLMEERKKKELRLKIEHRTSFFAILTIEQRKKASQIFKNSDLYVDKQMLNDIVQKQVAFNETKSRAKPQIDEYTQKQLVQLREEYARLKLIIDLKDMKSFEKEEAMTELRKHFRDDKKKIISSRGNFQIEDLHAYKLTYDDYDYTDNYEPIYD